MKREEQCPFLVCQVGLWCIVRPGCSGDTKMDPINGDLKVWNIDCLNCLGPDGWHPGARADINTCSDLPGDPNLF